MIVIENNWGHYIIFNLFSKHSVVVSMTFNNRKVYFKCCIFAILFMNFDFLTLLGYISYQSATLLVSPFLIGSRCSAWTAVAVLTVG